MERGAIPKWREEIEAMLREKRQGDDLEEWLIKLSKLIAFTQKVEKPSGEVGEVVAIMLRKASVEQPPLAATYSGFMLGVAWEKYQNANST